MMFSGLDCFFMLVCHFFMLNERQKGGNNLSRGTYERCINNYSNTQ